MYWIINDNIEFWPEHRKLISVHNADLNVVLTTPASRCLSLLLEAFPDVVAQQDFSPESGKKKVCVCQLTRYIRTYPLSDADFALLVIPPTRLLQPCREEDSRFIMTLTYKIM